jgi:hypothetical protein
MTISSGDRQGLEIRGEGSLGAEPGCATGAGDKLT